MNLQLICIYSGLPLWISCYPPTSKDKDTLISGFLSAINIFAKQTSGKNISSMTLGNYLWSFTTLFDIDDFFIASQIDLSGDSDEKNYKIKLNEELIFDVYTEFAKQYPKEFFQSYMPEIASFIEFQKYVDSKIVEFNGILTRYEKRDKKWLAEFGNSDKLFTAVMNRTPIVISYENIEELRQSDEFQKVQATFESIMGAPIRQIDNLQLDFLAMDSQDLSGRLFLMDSRNLTKIYSRPFAIVDYSTKNVIKGPDANPIAKKITGYLRKSSQSESANSSLILNKFINKNATELDNFLNENEVLFTEFQCKLCPSVIKFHINDESSFMSRKDHQVFFGMELTTYKVAHYLNEKMHVNSVLVDHRGIFHGLVEGFVFDINDYSRNEPVKRTQITSLTPDDHPIPDHLLIDSMFVIHREKLWIMDLIRPPRINSIELGQLILEKLQELSRVYSKPPDSSSFYIADKKYYFWFSNPILIVACFKHEEIFEIMDLVIKKLLAQKYQDNEWSIKRDRLNLALQYIEKVPLMNSNVPVIFKILFDDLIYTYIQTKYPDQIPRIVERLSKEFSLARQVLEGLLKNNLRVIDLLKNGFLKNARDLVDLMDFINRRNILV